MKVNYDMVDLGLPSGTLWAKCNLGAETETDYGLYFMWGDTKGEIKNDGKKFGHKNVPYYDKDNITYLKYNPCFDKKVTLDKYDDAVSKNMGLNYRMPTKEDFNELLANTNSEWITINGVSGRKFTSKNDSSKYIFIPASGYAYGGSIYGVGSCLYVWSSTLNTSSPCGAWSLFGDSTSCFVYSLTRWYGFSLRGVSR